MSERGKIKSPQQVFAEIYENKVWGAADEGAYYSGAGSHDPALVDAYVGAVNRLLAAFTRTLDAVDLGCGDFNVGSRLRHLFGGFVACDVVPALVERNRAAYAGWRVDFRCLDIVHEELPPGDIAFARQVFQHLSNADIQSVVAKLHRYKFLVATEHLPRGTGFPANVDQPTGAGTRVQSGSGVVLTAAPFALRPRAERTLCEVHGYGGVIRTTAYQLR
ncbi:MAG TPA: class I SAM-dependent methyltransferase [Burkholderiales bacterium]|nr:class I SAM-dependent methyltransferase [Burkholderiales bacterium]